VLNSYLRFPHAAQVACVRRPVLHISKNKTTLETVYLITSLTRAQASPEQLLELNRGHWGIEALHHVRDRAFDEDRCRARIRLRPARTGLPAQLRHQCAAPLEHAQYRRRTA